MKKFGLLIAVVFAMSTFVSGSALAQMQGEVGTPERMEMPGIFQANDLIGKKAVDVNEKEIGTVDNLFISDTGMVKYLLIAKTGAPEGELVAVPFSTVKSHDGEMVKLSITSEKIDEAPLFSKETFGPAWEAEVNSYYGEMEVKPEEPAVAPMGESESHGAMGSTYITGQQAAPGEFEQRGEVGGAETGMMATEDVHGVIRGSDLIGKSVLSQDGEDLGDIDNVIFDKDGQAKYAVISTGGFLGIGEKDVAVPFSMIQTAPEQEGLMVSIDRERMENAPAFDEQTYSSEWENQVNTYFGETGRTAEPSEAPMAEQGAPSAAAAEIVQMSNLLDKDVALQTGESVGNVDDVILQKGKLSYLLISTGEAEPIVVPWQSVSVSDTGLSLNIDQAKLENAPRFTEGDLQNVTSPEWSQRIHSYYGAEGQLPEGTMMERDQMMLEEGKMGEPTGEPMGEPAHGTFESY